MKSFEQLDNPVIDPRAGSPPASGELDSHGEHTDSHSKDQKITAANSSESTQDQTYQGSTTSANEKLDTIYVEFEPNDRRNPITYSRKKKWAITLAATYFTMLAAAAAGSYNMGFPTMIPELQCTRLEATAGLSLYALGFGIVPLLTSSFSEEFGRQPLYVCSITGFMLMQISIAVSKNIQTVLVLRVLLGGFGSTGSTMVGGTIADIWMPHERALPMALFGVSAIAGTGLGPFVGGWIVMNSRLDWRWIQWISAITSFVALLLIVIFMRETRSTVLLRKLAKKIRKETGDKRYRARIEDEGVDLKRLIWIASTRPALLLVTEPTVAAFSAWIGFAWGLVYLLLQSVSPVFGNLHNFNSGALGNVFLTMVLGALIGFASNFYQNHLYLEHFKTRGIEGRLYSCIIAGVILPISLLMYGLSCIPTVHWIVPVIALTLFMSGATVMYIASFIYLADCYGPYASSAVAGSSLIRNLGGVTFPLIVSPMYDGLTYRWANVLLAGVALLLMPVPFVLFYFGRRMRARSKFASSVIQMQEKAAQAQEEAAAEKRSEAQGNGAPV